MSGPLSIGLLSIGLLLTLACSAAGQDQQQAELNFFEARIRPVLVANCYECHSGLAKKVQGGLRVDSRDALRRGGESGPAVVAGDVDQSLLIEALRHESLEMPPGKKLPNTVIADFVRWIQRGAADPRDKPAQLSAEEEIRLASRRHWAFQPIGHPAPPAVANELQVQSPIDRFVLGQLEPLGLDLSPPADRVALARRAWFDLLGMPPKPEELAAFVNDDSPQAFERLVDRLLESPHYGERWGRYWLDVARYADNKGYVFFEEKRFPWAWTYRDYVVRSLNEDVPFDQFVLEQLAADQWQLGEDQRSLAGLGFLTLGGRFMNNTHDVLDDRIDVVTRGLMGLTVSCARCHDHKYDPVSAEDYYALYGVFRSSVEPLVPPEFQPSPDSDAYREFSTGLQERVKQLHDFIATQRDQIMAGARSRASEYLLAVHAKRNQPDTEDFMLLADKGDLNPAIIHRWEVYLRDARTGGDPIWKIWHAYAELSDEQFAAKSEEVRRQLLDGPAKDSVHPLVRQAFAAGPPADIREVAAKYGELLNQVDQKWRQLRENTAPAATTTPAPQQPAPQQPAPQQPAPQQPAPERLDDADWESVRLVLYGSHSPAMIPRELSWGFLDLLPDRPTQAEFTKLLKAVETWTMDQPGAPPRANVLVDAESLYDPVVFLRGNPHREGQPVARRFLSFLSTPDVAPFGSGSGRLELARRIVADDNPLTARVLVNRVWLHHFGQGLVDTPSDFGLRSDPPSHPELLDWLASEFREHGWSLKHLHRQIMNSAVYQQTGKGQTGKGQTGKGQTGKGQTGRGQDAANEKARQQDPENRLLWAYPRRRLDFEAIRDSLLTVSGGLDPTVGGPSLSVLEGFVPRRTIYGFVDRMDLPGLMRSFDFPDPAATSPQREQTTVAPQALYFMNHPFVQECAQRLLLRPDVQSCESDDQRIERIYQILFSRSPDAAERELARTYLQPREPSSTVRAWSYGYAAVDDAQHQVQGFTPLLHWTGSRWQGGPQLPDPKLGWVFLDREGGHPAESLDRCAVRRWTAPVAGSLEIRGTLKHFPQPGNGVRGRIVSSREGLLGQWSAHQQQVDVGVLRATVQVGDTIDFVVDFQGEIQHDEHHWPVTIRQVAAEDDATPAAPSPAAPGSNQPVPAAPALADWDSQRDFRGDVSDPWVDYLHGLLMTNEFVFVD